MPRFDQIELERAAALFDAAVLDADGVRVGWLDDLLIEPDTAQPRWAVVCIERFPREIRVILPPSELFEDGYRVWTSFRRDHLVRAPAAVSGHRFSTTVERAARRHFGQPPVESRRESVSLATRLERDHAAVATPRADTRKPRHRRG